MNYLVPVSLEAIDDAVFALGLSVRGTGLGWQPSEVLALPWSSIERHCTKIGDLWKRLSEKRKK